MSSEQRPGKESLSSFRGPEPAKASDELPPTPPVSEDDHSAPPAEGADDVRVAGTEPEKKVEPPPARKMPPGDEQRAKMAERFAERRRAERGEPDMDVVNPDGIYGKLAGESGDPPPEDGGEKPDPDKKAPAAGPSVSEKPETITLVVNGRTVTKTVAEVAALSELTEDEVRNDGARAKKYAQRELASQDNLERSRIARRDQPARQPDDTGTRTARPAPNQERTETGDDDPDQTPASRDTSDDEWEKLAEDIQIGDPKDVAKKLKDAVAKAAEHSAKGVVHQGEGDRLRKAELESNFTAVKEFLDEHTNLAGKPSIAAAIKAGLDTEYRADLRSVLLNEGESEEEADRILSSATPDQIRDAHLARRLDRNPHVRTIDKAMMTQVYEKVRSDFGVTEQTEQKPALSRQDRKEALPQQPRRASLPPATPPAPTAQLSRRAVVAEMATRTGRKRSTLPR